MKARFLTDRGQVRSHNEDSGGVFYNSSGQFLAVIADGMGGHQAGDVASQMATTLLEEKWNACDHIDSPEETENWVQNAIREINVAIYNHAQENKECYGMGTTIVIVIVIRDFMTIAHIGDSRCYKRSGDGLKQITEDHSLVNALVQSGQITKDDALSHPRKNVVLKALGTEEVIESDVMSLGLEPEDRLLLCTDGLTDKVMDKELSEIMDASTDLQEIGEKMISLANERGGEDNISLIIFQYSPSEEAGESSC
ncbi:MAG: Stp1/IreP family PP2C-type Ser/Thr phosphatase [Bacillota bacterium]|uniref:protein-serine/threonine phosphatase n=1 Tax=Virgibacillus salarius TaxID=447199 RepID=A0A941I872_9BACI|nr:MULTISPECIES: Stp1/IreP family PP2C-type Ser/Thr phosphatase [Bacillaceae]NAZ08004.1 Stp1/IreP family PP2C-type Ser/Thr phosphatase [Agaribacter marinus]MBR7795289.1 Stp1/IreP family PP2C-type Ser/Thr phosphatase [Virgibacillus salarius]MCC2251910.1 Stp1/IreP family PP2C-type Ser/Thr phosphatase [Virgibacillus sp. AGTR]MDY7045634.1 Stp1/IreP family PP2C-type Ser/Thr phosphatase [Virgibacillus sp. M23]QRZ17365.1 Stp1/IreP family PP2C-type Ser/Thr phosphatase [Virgibacillus sp. AGTR]